MILKHYSRLRLYLPHFPHSATKKVTQTPSPPHLEIDRRFSEYLFSKFEANSLIERELNELKKSAELFIGKSSPQLMGSIQRILSELPFDAIAEENLSIIRDMVAVVRQKKAGPQSEEICGEIEKKMREVDGKNEGFNSLFRLYRINEEEERSARRNKAEIILNNLKKTTLTVQQMSFFFENIRSVSILTPLEQQIRLLLLRRIRTTVSEISVKLLSKVARCLNAVSHYDFLPEQLDIVKEIFGKMTDRYQEMTSQILEQILQADQYSSNIITLAPFYFNIISLKLLEVKRHNSAQSHEVFHLIGLVNSKISNILKASIFDRLRYEAFVLRHLEVNGKAAKHCQKVFSTISTLIQQNCISQEEIENLNNIIMDTKKSPSVKCLYHLTRLRKGNQLKSSAISEAELSENEEIIKELIPMMINRRLNRRGQLETAFIAKHFLNAQIFVQLLEKMERANISTLFQEFHLIFENEVEDLFDKLEMSTLRKDDQQRLLRYFISVQSLVNNKKFPLHKHSGKFPIMVLEAVASARVSNPSNKQLERYIDIAHDLVNTNEGKRSISLALTLLQRLVLRYREGSFSLASKLRFKRMLYYTVHKSDVFLENGQEIFTLFSELIHQIITNYNSNYNEYRLNGFYPNFLQKLLEKTNHFDFSPALKQLIVKQAFDYNAIHYRNVQHIERIDESALGFYEREKIKHLRYHKHGTVIEEINEQTLPIVIFNRLLHDRLQKEKGKAAALISSATPAQFQKYLREMSFFSIPLSPYIFDQVFMHLKKQLSTKVDFNTIQRRIFTSFCSRFFMFEEVENLIFEWMIYFSEHAKEIEDIETHLSIIMLLKTGRYSQKNSENGARNSYPSHYIRILIDKYKYCQYQYEEILYHLLFTGFKDFDYILKDYLEARKVRTVVTSFLFLHGRFTNEERTKMLGKITEFVKGEQYQREGVESLTLYEYKFIKAIYPKQTSNFNIPESQLRSPPFSKSTPQAMELLNLIAKFLDCELVKVNLDSNDIYTLRQRHVIFLPVEKQSSYLQFEYLNHLMKVLCEPCYSVTIIARSENSSFINIPRTFKLSNIISKEEFAQYFKWANSEDKARIEERNAKMMKKEDREAKKVNYLDQLRKNKKTIMKYKLRK